MSYDLSLLDTCPLHAAHTLSPATALINAVHLAQAAEASGFLRYWVAHLIAEKAGLKLKIVPAAWADWSLGLSSGKYDAVISNVTVTEERKQKYDFATYRRDVLGFYVANNSKIQSVSKAEDIAGLNVITDSGTNQELILLDWDRQNVAKGLPAIKVQYYDDPGLMNIAPRNGTSRPVRQNLIMRRRSADFPPQQPSIPTGSQDQAATHNRCAWPSGRRAGNCVQSQSQSHSVNHQEEHHDVRIASGLCGTFVVRRPVAGGVFVLFAIHAIHA